MAIDNDKLYNLKGSQLKDFSAKVKAKADQATTYTKSEVDNLIPDVSVLATKSEVSDGLALKADKSTTYTKTEVDGLIPDVSGFATKTELSEGLAEKADIATTYTKTEVDTALGLKADKTELPDMTDYYDKTETDALLTDKADKADTYTKAEVDGLIPDISVLATKDEVSNGLALKADKSTTYTKSEVDGLLVDKADKATTYTKTEVDTELADKQDTLVSGTNIKTVNGERLLGSGDIPVGSVTYETNPNVYRIEDGVNYNHFYLGFEQSTDGVSYSDASSGYGGILMNKVYVDSALDTKQDLLIAGTGITIDPNTNTISSNVDLTGYYNKTETDALLDDKADAATTYTKTEVDTALSAKADTATTYTKTEVDDLMDTKEDASVVFNAGTDYPYATMSAALDKGNVFIKDGSVNRPVIYFQDDSSESTLYIFVEGGLQGSPSQVCYRWISGEYQEKTEKYIVPTGGRAGQVLTKSSTSIGDYGWADATGGGAEFEITASSDSASLGQGNDYLGIDLSDANGPTLTLTQPGTYAKNKTLQEKLVSGTNIKTVANQSLLGSGDVEFKTINSSSISGSGNLNTGKVTSDYQTNSTTIYEGTDSSVQISKDGNDAIRIQGYGEDDRGATQTLYDMSLASKNYVDGKAGVNLAVGQETWYGTYTDENNVTYQTYSKTIFIPALPSAAGITTYPIGVTNMKQIISISGVTTDGFVLNAPRQTVTDNITIYQTSKGSQTFSIEVGKDRSNKSAYVTIIYAKNN